jgi:hypothetical protein
MVSMLRKKDAENGSSQSVLTAKSDAPVYICRHFSSPIVALPVTLVDR